MVPQCYNLSGIKNFFWWKHIETKFTMLYLYRCTMCVGGWAEQGKWKSQNQFQETETSPQSKCLNSWKHTQRWCSNKEQMISSCFPGSRCVLTLSAWKIASDGGYILCQWAKVTLVWSSLFHFPFHWLIQKSTLWSRMQLSHETKGKVKLLASIKVPGP